ncbi:hypothetical protein [Limoniibacter endophyticus]|uniref:Uncharacterized protein n=1 Tax=Limoniibacter endophyticus TaxID=1565040 RepID=A0A8J3DRP9_9HYPH|nr:hypothetical protein [Limoniibacter endophyticus]GHC75681.1 hypothetical protein GCM10010136_25870 [Limoniibacter endophyticus]
MEDLKFIEHLLRIYVCVYALSHISPAEIYSANFAIPFPATRFRRLRRLSTAFFRVLFHLVVATLIYSSLVRAVIALGMMGLPRGFAQI